MLPYIFIAIGIIAVVVAVWARPKASGDNDLYYIPRKAPGKDILIRLTPVFAVAFAISLVSPFAVVYAFGQI